MGIQWCIASAMYRLLKPCDSVRREGLCNYLIEFIISVKLVTLMKNMLN